jgi:predicted Zn-dependent protease
VLLDVVKDASGIRGGTCHVLVAATRSVYASGLDRSDELAADLRGTVIAARAGSDPYGLQRVLPRLEGIAPASDALGFLASTHPPFRTRIDGVDGALAGELDTVGGETAGESLAGIQARLRVRAAS